MLGILRTVWQQGRQKSDKKLKNENKIHNNSQEQNSRPRDKRKRIFYVINGTVYQYDDKHPS